MGFKITFFSVLGLLHVTQGLWQCRTDADCSVEGSLCSNGDCVCPVGQQLVRGGTLCADLAPYHTSECVEQFQCSRMFTAFDCARNNETDDTGSCLCQPGHHYFLGRCWSTSDYGQSCSRDEECLSILSDPFSLACDGVCGCAEGYYLRQRGECRRIAHAIGDGCVIDEDCQFNNGVCDPQTFRCYDRTNPASTSPVQSSQVTNTTTRSATHGVACDMATPCEAPFECSTFGACVCALGYFSVGDGACYAEIGSPSTPEQCVGLFTEVRDGVCTCMANFNADVTNMRDCIKANRNLQDSCVTDAQCFTFGAAARCGAPGLWGLRGCECAPEVSVWDGGRMMCRLFAGIGESCEVDSDCLAGELEIHCEKNAEGQGFCTCPEGLVAHDGLCLTTGLELGDSCQADVECTETPNTVCEAGRCSCDSSGYQEIEGFCAPVIGGVCALDTDCVIDHTVCYNDTVSTCQCGDQYVAFDNECLLVSPGNLGACVADIQCWQSMGEDSECSDGQCLCVKDHHYRDGSCWPETGLFEGCSRTSQCFLADVSDRVICRNSLCQCDFEFPYSEELNTCTSSAAKTYLNGLILSLSAYLMMT